MLELRPVPAAGVMVGLTRRCPLHCAHCSTASTMHSEQGPAGPMLRFVEGFGRTQPPEVLVLSGGEPLLRPRLVSALTTLAHAAGTRVSLISGMFFARGAEVPAAIKAAIAGVDLLTASIDEHHEREVPRAAVLDVLEWAIGRGVDVTVQVTGAGPDDPYVTSTVADLRAWSGDQVPLTVVQVAPVGRGAGWVPAPAPGERQSPLPCGIATWPVIAFDGTIVACCSQGVVDGPAAPHLRVGHIATDDWASVRERVVSRPLLRVVRTYGPEHVAGTFGSGACDGYCATCHRLSDDPGVAARAEAHLDSAMMQIAEPTVTAPVDAVDYARTFCMAGYADLVALGRVAAVA